MSQRYYLPYACKTRADLRDWWVVYKVAPHGHISSNNSSAHSNLGEGPAQDAEFYQEDGLEDECFMYAVINSLSDSCMLLVGA